MPHNQIAFLRVPRSIEAAAELTHMWLGAAFSVMLSRGVVLAAGLAAGIITARVLGPEGRGQYFALTTLAAIVAQASNLGMSSSNIFLGAQNPKAAWPLLVNSAWLAVIVAMLATLTIWVFGPSIAGKLEVPQGLLWAACVLSPAVLFFTLACSVLVGEERFVAVNAWQVANALLTVAMLGCAALFYGSVEWLIAATTCAAALTVIALGVFVGLGRFGGLTFKADLFAAGWQFASRAYVVLLLGFLMQRVSVAILMLYGDPKDIGMYSIASQIFDVLVILPSSVAMVIFPGLVKHANPQWASIRSPLLTTVAVMVVMCAAIAVVAESVVTLVFSAAFAPAALILYPLLPGVVFTAITAVVSQLVVAKRFPTSLIVIWAVALVCMIATAIFLVRDYGAIGVAAGQSIGSAVACIGVIALAWRRIANSKAQ